ncbi:MAG: hypothetical protein MSG64_06760 [Pyrinomonadaceae bacterium MAG19_C2-C3]|nr:hypothetical protein [Pyrinomonadaceae bacterium MAG19_C2-C3]
MKQRSRREVSVLTPATGDNLDDASRIRYYAQRLPSLSRFPLEAKLDDLTVNPPSGKVGCSHKKFP